MGAVGDRSESIKSARSTERRTLDRSLPARAAPPAAREGRTAALSGPPLRAVLESRSHIKGGRLSAAYKSREETPKEGMSGQTCTAHQSSKRFIGVAERRDAVGTDIRSGRRGDMNEEGRKANWPSFSGLRPGPMDARARDPAFRRLAFASILHPLGPCGPPRPLRSLPFADRHRHCRDDGRVTGAKHNGRRDHSREERCRAEPIIFSSCPEL